MLTTITAARGMSAQRSNSPLRPFWHVGPATDRRAPCRSSWFSPTLPRSRASALGRLLGRDPKESFEYVFPLLVLKVWIPLPCERICGACPRCAGPGCCAARRAAVKGPASRPFGRPSLTRLAATLRARWRAGCSRTVALRAWPVRSPMQRSRLRLHRDAEQPGQAGGVGGHTTAARSRARGSRARFPSRVRERGPLDELTGLQVAAPCSARCGAGQIVTPVTRHARCRAAERVR
jgi:hypothetical protein